MDSYDPAFDSVKNGTEHLKTLFVKTLIVPAVFGAVLFDENLFSPFFFSFFAIERTLNYGTKAAK
jgi:hypothetical protein